MEHTGTNNHQETVADTSQVDNSGYAGHNRQHSNTSNPSILAMANFDSRHFAKVLLQHARCVQHQGAASHAVPMDVAGHFEAQYNVQADLIIFALELCVQSSDSRFCCC
jgi:hypothetical protein